MVVEPIWFSAQRVLRTVVQVGIPAFLTFAGVLPVIIDALGLPVDGKVYLWLVSAAAVVTAVAAGLSRVMAIPTVNRWLTAVGLGSVPRAIAKEQAAAKSPELQPAQFEPSTIDYRTEQQDEPRQ
ncbi:hypothetical protein [Curtobacterium sp. MCBD17_030]|uniref:hypothetical protein n=1 Tax=Curtobacterium sp. MCBD17_030 TaxID=2175649 RepID=UPI0011B6E14F|nr:hypothetical protein [Curtobacterium sp. MCBD17_030]